MCFPEIPRGTKSRQEGDAPPVNVTVAVDELRESLVRHLSHVLRLDPKDAACTVEHWIRSERAGKPCHGLIRALHLTEPGRYGPYGDVPAPRPVRLGPGRLHVDGTGALGYPILEHIVESGSAEASELGFAVVTGAGIYPSGSLGDWARLACERGCGILLMSGSPPRVAAPGGHTPLLGTNPICIGLPTRPHAFVCDVSSSAITHGDLLLAEREGTPLPADAAVDENGARTRTASDVAALLSIGDSHKTFALAMAIELLTSLGGSIPGSKKHEEHGVLAIFLGPQLVESAETTLSERLAAFAEAGARIPGWESERRAAASPREVVELSRETYDALSLLLFAAKAS